jgi:hypothetical protein
VPEASLASLTDRLFSEVDRQLAEVRDFADGVATRAGLLVSASALTAGLLGSQLATIKDEWPAIAALVALGGATLFGIFVFAPGLTAGPAAAALGNWARRTASAGGGDERAVLGQADRARGKSPSAHHHARTLLPAEHGGRHLGDLRAAGGGHG